MVHDWLTGMRGGEYVLEAIAELFPQADVFTLLHVEGSVSVQLAYRRIHTSLLQYAPWAKTHYRHYLPLMPAFASGLDVSKFDLVVSSSHCVAKGVKKRSDAVHVSYVHAPMRYMWDRFDDYFGPNRASTPVRALATLLRGRLQHWDRKVSHPSRVDRIVANSHFIAHQVERAYGRKASVVHPFVNLERFTARRVASERYLMVGAFAPNKRVDLAIETFNALGLPLDIVGKGQQESHLRAIAGPNIRFLGALSNDEIATYYSRARAFVFPGVEDFGITPLEAMAAGCPVIAYGQGGALETVLDGVSGVIFEHQTVDALSAAVRKLESGAVQLNEGEIRTRAHQFSKRRFQREFLTEVASACAASGADELVQFIREKAQGLADPTDSHAPVY